LRSYPTVVMPALIGGFLRCGYVDSDVFKLTFIINSNIIMNNLITINY